MANRNWTYDCHPSHWSYIDCLDTVRVKLGKGRKYHFSRIQLQFDSVVGWDEKEMKNISELCKAFCVMVSGRWVWNHWVLILVSYSGLSIDFSLKKLRKFTDCTLDLFWDFWHQKSVIFMFPCREYVEEQSEVSPVCIYMRDEVSQQTHFSTIPLHLPLKMTKLLCIAFQSGKWVPPFDSLKKGNWKDLVSSKFEVFCGVREKKNPAGT